MQLKMEFTPDQVTALMTRQIMEDLKEKGVTVKDLRITPVVKSNDFQEECGKFDGYEAVISI